MLSLSLLIFFTVIINLYSGIYVYLANRSSSINKTFFLTCIMLCLWGMGYTFLLPAGSLETANYWRILATFGECFLFSYFLLFCIIFTHQQGLWGKMWVKSLLFVPGALLFFKSLTFSGQVLIKTYWGWMYLYDSIAFWKVSFVIYYLLYTLGAIWFIYRWGCRATTAREKKQAGLIVGLTLVVLAIASMVDVVLPFFGIRTMPIDVIVLTMLTGGVWYSIIRYGFLMLNFELAASHILSDMIDPLILTDKNLIIIEANKAAFALTGCTPDKLVGKPLTAILGGQPELAAVREAALEEQGIINQEVAFSDSQGHTIPCLLSVKTLYDEFNEVIGQIFLLHDITKRKQFEQLLQKDNDALEKKVRERTMELENSNFSLQKEIIERKNMEIKLQHYASHDTLTSLPNRRLYQVRLVSAVERAKTGKNVLAVLYLDMDNFKFLNDTFGHSYGDLVLKEVAGRMQRLLKSEDVLSRVGGDEFLFLLDNLSPQDAKARIQEVTGALLDMFKTPYYIHGRECFLSASIGVAVYPEDGLDAETLARNADIAMYEAKDIGKSTCTICSAEIKYRVAEKAEIRNRLFRALENREFLLYYQPQIDIVTKQIRGFEALLRWQTPSGQFIPPGDFIPVAEETGLIVPIGKWVMETAFAQLRWWHDMGCSHLRMAVNVSARQLMEKDFVGELVACLDRLKLERRQIELEITESIAFKKNEDILSALRAIKQENINISIDDFGTEYSSFMNIKEMPVNRLKIAMPFVSGISKNVKDAAIVSSIIALSHNLGMNVIAEGVETAEEAEYLGLESCDEIQGYYFYRPMPPESITAILQGIC